MRLFLRFFIRSREGSVAIITALAIIPMTLLIGAGIDYGMAADRKAQLEGYRRRRGTFRGDAHHDDRK